MTLTYLDTQVTVWLASGAIGRLTPDAKKHIDATPLKISPAVLLELEYLYEIRRLILPALDVVNKLEHEIGLEICDLDFARIVSTAVNEKWTRDPFDRLITAHAKANGLAYLISSDDEIKANYPRTIW